MEAKRNLVKEQFDRGLSTNAIIKRLAPLGINKMFVYRTVARLRDTGNVQDRPRSGRPRSIRTKERIKRIREKIRRNPQRSVRQLAKEEVISQSSMRWLVSDDLGLRPYRKRKVHGLTKPQREARLKRCKGLLKRHGPKKVERIIFSDEKLFLVQQSYNAKNDVVYSAFFEDIPEHLRTVQRYQNTSSVMVWGAISSKGKLPLKFIEKGVKINAEYYQAQVLESVLIPEANRLYPGHDWIFQQDSAPAHRAKSTQSWLERHAPAFVTEKEWPPSSPDLNPLDYHIWGVLEGRVNAKQHRSLESMRRALLREWSKLSMKSVRAAVGCWRSRLDAVIQHEGGRFE